LLLSGARRCSQHQVDDVVGQVVNSPTEMKIFNSAMLYDPSAFGSARDCRIGPGRSTAAPSGSSSRPTRPTPFWADAPGLLLGRSFHHQRRDRTVRQAGYIASAMLRSPYSWNAVDTT
jgi:hypothetical protein